MLSEEFVNTEKANLVALGDQLHKEATFARQFLDQSKRPLNERQWFATVRDISIYGTFLIQILLESLEKYIDKPEEQIGFYVGKIAIQSFLDIINAFEKSTNDLVGESILLRDLLTQRIDQKVAIIEDSWKDDVPKKSRRIKADVIALFRRKMFEMKFIRDTLHQDGVIDDLDKKILDFAWDIRNSMHSNYVVIKDIAFAAPGTSLNYTFEFEKGQELYHPTDLLSFYSMTEQIIFIQLKVLQHFNKLMTKDA